MKQKIKSITEAFSMQPIRCYVGESPSNLNTLTATIERIELEPIGEDLSAYIGYDSENNKLFQYLFNSVNVYYI